MPRYTYCPNCRTHFWEPEDETYFNLRKQISERKTEIKDLGKRVGKLEILRAKVEWDTRQTQKELEEVIANMEEVLVSVVKALSETQKFRRSAETWLLEQTMDDSRIKGCRHGSRDHRVTDMGC